MALVRSPIRWIVLLAALGFPAGASAQAPVAIVPPPTLAAAAHGEQIADTPGTFLRTVLRDQGRIWTFPQHAARGRHWKLVVAFASATAALVALDPHDTPYFRRTQNFSTFNHAFSGLGTGLAEGLTPVGFLLVGTLGHDSSATRTALLSGEALVDAEIVALGVKNVGRRLRPSDIRPDGDFADTWFRAGGGVLLERSSFPSGHSIGAFALAAVFAERYRQHRWVPWVAYGLAGVVGLSRITLQAHFPSDVFAGGFLGSAIGRDVTRD
jgi:membrane-associated phospholipid phosphatase